MNVDEAEKKAVDYLQTKFSPKSIKVTSAGFGSVPNQIAVKGELEDKDGTLNDFEVSVNALSGSIFNWKTTKH